MAGPDFFLVGAPKSGTTSLFRYLIQHPSVFVPVKETQFFADYPSARGSSDLDEYLALYEGCPDGSRSGDLSTWYLPSVHAARKIHALNPTVRIAMILRNPIDRAYSHYWYKRRVYRGGMLARLVSGPFPGRSLLKRALRGRLRDVKQRLASLNADCPPAMRPGTRAQLVERFRPDIERLERIVGRDLGHWLSSTAFSGPTTLLEAAICRSPRHPNLEGEDGHEATPLRRSRTCST